LLREIEGKGVATSRSLLLLPLLLLLMTAALLMTTSTNECAGERCGEAKLDEGN
jgi:hypothetical protein